MAQSMTLLMSMANGDVPVSYCALCELGDARPTQPKAVGEVIAVFRDENMVVFLQPPLQVVAVAPTSHVVDLSHFDAGALGAFLAALRRVAMDVGSVFRCSGATIAPADAELPQSEGHVCFHVIPTLQNGVDQLEPSDPLLQAERLAEHLR
jgi:diadenosine tetraphosphate (Ap4A) HIT family hydrolase